MQFRFKNFTASAAAMLILATAVIGVSATPAYAQDATVRVVHGIPGRDVGPDLDPALPVDILVNDAICLLQGFPFGTIEGPFTIPAGTYNFKISLANTLSPCEGAVVLDADVPIGAGENVSIVAHLTAGGAPTAGKFVNDFSGITAGQATIVAHHVAAAPSVDVSLSLNFNVAKIRGLANAADSSQRVANVPANTYVLGVAPAGSPNAIFSTVLNLRPSRPYLIYAVGSLTNETFALIVEPIGGVQGVTVLR